MSKSSPTDLVRGLADLITPRFFKALCDPNRIALLVGLAKAKGPRTVSQIARCCPVDLSVVSRHLATLRDAGIVEAGRHGKEVRYRIRARDVVETLRNIADAIEAAAKSEPDADPT